MWAVAGGYADLDAERAVNLDERVLTGSISTLPTAVAVLQLVAEGTGLDDRLASGDDRREPSPGLRLGRLDDGW